MNIELILVLIVVGIAGIFVGRSALRSMRAMRATASAPDSPACTETCSSCNGSRSPTNGC